MNPALIVHRRALLPLCLAFLTSSAVCADPLSDHDNGPLKGYFGIPDSTEGSVVLDAGDTRWSASVMTASHSFRESRNGETVVLDGETTRLALALNRGLRHDLEIGIEIPFLLHESGGLDSVIDTWHDWFGFPDGFRAGQPQNEIEFLYSVDDSPLVEQLANQNGLGDVRLMAGWQVRRTEDHALALRLGLKLPTGDSDTLSGSGGTDLSLGLAGDHFGVFGISGLDAFYRAHAVYLGEPDRLADRYNDLVGFVAFGGGYSVTERFELRLQLAARSAIYESDIEILGDPSLTVTFGAHIRVSPSYRLSLGVSEDLKVDSAPDVAFQLALQFLPE